MRFIDLTLLLDNECMTCGTPWHARVSVSHLGRLEKEGRNTSRIVLGSHSGTHLDAPLHFIDGGKDVTGLELETLCGPVSVVDFFHKQKGDIVLKEDLEGIAIKPRMIFRYGWYDYWKTGRYYDSFPYLSMEAAVWLVEGGLRMIAMDTPSPDTGSNINGKGCMDSPVHKYFLKNDVVIVEYLTNTRSINSSKENFIIALPLRVAGADGSPSRVLVMEQ